MEFKKVLTEYKTKLERELEFFLTQKQQEVATLHPFVKQAVDILKEYTLRGSAKRIRGALICVGHKAFAGKDSEDILKVSCAIELIHAYFLVHDDIIDRDSIRRGGDTVHTSYSKMAKAEKLRMSDTHFGDSIAIIIGDICATFGYDAILRSSFPADKKIKALKYLNDMICQTCFGQLLDIRGAEDCQMTEKDIIEVYLNKTARYSIEAPLQIGAVLAGASKKQLSLLSDYALPVGIVFQLNNDLSEVFVSEDKIDEKTAGDIKEGKQPLFIIRALLNGNKEQRKIILNLLGKKEITKEALKDLQKIIKETGALTYTEEFAKNKILEGKKALKNLVFKHKPAYAFLEQLGDHILNLK